MNRCIIIFIAAFIVTSSSAQSDFIQLKKNNKTIQSWFRDNYIYVQLKNGQWINAIIYKIQYDSLYLRPFTVHTYINRIGLNYIDTTFYGLMTVNINNINAFPRKDEGSGLIKNGTLFKIGGGGYLLLNIINTLSNDEPVFGADNIPNISIAASVLALGIILGLTHKSTFIIGKKYHIEYISAKPS